MGIEFYEGEQFWKSPSGYKPGKRLTDEQLADIEMLLQVKLPPAYIALMKEQNGGELQYRYALFDDGEACVIPFFHELDKGSGVGLTPVFLEACGLPEGLVLLMGDLECWVALDYRKSEAEPSIVYLLNNEDGEWEEEQIALSFSEFTKKLFMKKI